MFKEDFDVNLDVLALKRVKKTGYMMWGEVKQIKTTTGRTGQFYWKQETVDSQRTRREKQK